MKKYSKAIVAACFAGLAATNTALIAAGVKVPVAVSVTIAIVIAVGTTFGVYQVRNES